MRGMAMRERGQVDSAFDAWYENYPDTLPYMEGMEDAFEAGRQRGFEDAKERAAQRCEELGKMSAKLQDVFTNCATAIRALEKR